MKPHKVFEHVESIEERNRRVEADKAWETSLTRRFIIAIGTYGIVALYLGLLNVEKAYLHALVPAGAYLISTISLPALKHLWLKIIYTRRSS